MGHGGAWAGFPVVGAVSTHLGQVTCVGCGPEARPALGFTSSLAQTQATLSPILQTRPGFLSHRPHPA